MYIYIYTVDNKAQKAQHHSNNFHEYECSMQTVFREEADCQKNRLYGKVSLAQPISIYYTFSVLFISFIFIVLFLCFSNYSKKESIQGYLVLDKGIIHVYPNKVGSIEKIHVSEGELVKKGDSLATIVLKQSMLSGDELGDSIINELNLQISLLEENLEINNAIKLKDISRINTSIHNYNNSTIVLSNLERLTREKLAIHESQHIKNRKLYMDGFISTEKRQVQKEKLLKIKQELENIKSDKIKITSQINIAKANLDVIPNKNSLLINEISKQRSQLLRKILEIKSNYKFVVKAAESGTITSIKVVAGGTTSANIPLLSLIPEGAELVAELFLPTRSAGFINYNNEVRLRFDAFPFQRFGSLTSSISTIDKILLIDDKDNNPITISEPVYRLRAKLSEQTIQGHGNTYHLKNGMLLEADIILEKRKLIDWLLAPLYTFKGKLN